jgi:threonine synthase
MNEFRFVNLLTINPAEASAKADRWQLRELREIGAIGGSKSMSYRIECVSREHAVPDGSWWRCPSCKGSLTVIYDSQNGRPLYPLINSEIHEPGVGNTPLILLEGLSHQFGCDIWVKCEQMNPNGSFKDRGSPIEIAKAKECNKLGIVVASTGNMAASLSVLAREKNLSATIVIPARTSKQKVETIQRNGGTVYLVNGPYDACVPIAEHIAIEQNGFLCGDYLLREQGQKTIGWELAQSGVLFDAMFIPVGNGNIAVALYKGWEEAVGRKHMPQFVGIQPALCNPITIAWKSRSSIKAQYPTHRTEAAGFDVGNPLDGQQVLSLVQSTHGMMIDVTDLEMYEAQDELERVGLHVELSAAAPLAGFKKVAESYRNQIVCFILTGGHI